MNWTCASKTWLKISASAALSLLCIFATSAKSAVQVKSPSDEHVKHYLWLVHKLQEGTSIKLGMTKADLLNEFAKEEVSESSGDEQIHRSWLLDRFRETESIKAGMKGTELMKLFTLDGGLQHIPQPRFVLRSCSLIKVKVEFEGDVLPELKAGVLLADETWRKMKIKSISKPYLEPMHMD